MTDYNTFDFMVTDENEVMLLLYARNSEPKNPTVHLNYEKHSIVLRRNEEDEITLEQIEDLIFDDLQDENTLLVCEIAPTEKEDENEIIYTYEADIID